MRRGLPARWRELVRSVPRWTTKAEYSNDGGATWRPATFVAGSCTADANAQVRWSANLTLADVDLGRGGLNAYTSRLRIWHGIAGMKLLPMGLYRVNRVQQASQQPEQVQIDGESFEAYLIDAEFPVPRSLRPLTAEYLVAHLVGEILPNMTIVWRGDINPAQAIPQLTGVSSRWALIDGNDQDPSAAKATGGIVYCGPAGELTIAPPGSLADEPTWETKLGETLIDSTVEQDRDSTANIVVVTGEPTTGTAVIGPIIERDDDPTSITYWNRSPDAGGFGAKVHHYAAPTITSTVQARRVARAQLAQRQGLRQTVNFTRLHDPSIEPGDVGLVDTEAGQLRMIIDSITYDLTGAPMQANTRTTSTLLTGLTYAAPEGEAA